MHRAAVILALLALAALAGGMAFFGAVLAPAVFRTLEQPTSGRFIRAIFPQYYRFSFIAAVLAAIGLIPIAPWCAVVLALVVLATLWLWLWLRPRLNRLRDAEEDRSFSRGHRLSVLVNQIELLAAVAVLVRLAFLV